jgi:hypothetical protein
MTQWQQFYQSIRDASWPDCVNEQEFYLLPQHIQQEIVELHNGRPFVAVDSSDLQFLAPGSRLYQPNSHNQDPATCDQTFAVASDFVIQYAAGHDGGGTAHCQNYSRVLRYLYPNRVFDSCLEWCSGPGFIGFRLLSDGICRNLTLQDVYQPALQAAEQTWQHRPARLASAQLHVVATDTIQSMPTNLTFDLVVANPPNYDNPWLDLDCPDQIRITQDVGWRIHQEFFANIGARLHRNGRVILIKAIESGSVDTYMPWITQGGLQVVRVFRERIAPGWYYMELKHQ